MLRTVISTGNTFCKRSFNSKVNLYKKPVREIEIPVPWGKLAGKLWGDDDQQPILALHGWQDNAGSFNNLAPLLQNCSLLAIDWPGHGHSSWLPPGMMYSEFHYLSVITRIKRHFGWERIKLMAHSFGGIISFTYASLFNNETEFVISIDSINSPSVDTNSNNRILRTNLEKVMEFENLPVSSVPSYSEEEAINRWRKATNDSLDEESCKELLIRGTRKKADGTVYFRRDPRLKIPTMTSGRTHNDFKCMAKEIKNPYLVIKATDSPYMEGKSNFFEVADVMKEHSIDFSFHKVPGKHHLHMTSPSAVVEVLNPFLQKYNH